jgi:hypothetical protein
MIRNTITLEQTQAYQKVIAFVLDLYKNPNTFCQKTEARNREGKPVVSLDKDACSWCISGALYLAASTIYKHEKETTYPFVPFYNELTEWLDDELEQHAGYLFNDGVAYYHIMLNDDYGFNDVLKFLKEMQRKLKKIERTMFTA